MAELTVEQMEQYVRAAWDEVREEVQHSVKEAPRDWRGYVLAIIGNREEMIASGKRAERWPHAYRFTIAREEEVRQIDEEIYFVKDALCGDNCCGGCEARRRTLARLQAIKAELQRGMSAQTKEATDAK